MPPSNWNVTAPNIPAKPRELNKPFPARPPFAHSFHEPSQAAELLPLLLQEERAGERRPPLSTSSSPGEGLSIVEDYMALSRNRRAYSRLFAAIRGEKLPATVCNSHATTP